VPKGKTFSFKLETSKIFPGTSRTITVYVPAQYTGDKPACVYVGLDGLGFGVTTVFDNLIHKKEMPVTIAVGVSPGIVASTNDKENPRFNRSFEFDGLNDSLARLIVEEIFPEVERHPAPDGLPIKLSRDPNDRCTGGGSTGGIGAFTLAWERPDQFRRVFTAIGTFVGMRGGDRYPVLVRKTEPKPIRVFMQDGSNDQWMGGPEVGDWWMGNQTLQRALEFAGYDHQHVWGTGPHSGKHATAIFPDAMRFLWKDWPQPIQAQTAKTQNVVLKSILDPEATWQRVGDAGDACDRPAVNPKGEVFFCDTASKRMRKLGADGTVSEEPTLAADKVIAFSAEGRAIVVSDLQATCLAVAHDGRVYATEADAGKAWLVTADGRKRLLDEGLKRPTGIALSPDGLWLAVMESQTHWGYSYRVKADGTVELKQRFYWFHVPDWADDSGAGSMCMDRDGRPYVATHVGVQVFDRNGRSRGILPMPEGEATSVCFGGEKFETLFVTSGGKLYQRKMKAAGAPAFASPIKLPPWGGG
jgi:sugar lactone lactonase YvrE/enterochelin esterase-like enzyme